MERVMREKNHDDFSNSRRAAQEQSARHSAQSEIAASIDNSPRMVAQRISLNSLFGGTAQLREMEEKEPLQGLFSGSGHANKVASYDPTHSIVQLLTYKNAASPTKYQITYEGKKDDFSGGTIAGPKGVAGVEKYQATVWRAGRTNMKDDPANTGSDVMDNTKQGFAAGHMLAKSLGGPGDSYNIFKQDAGQNNSEWRSAENEFGKFINKAHADNKVTYTMTLTGTSLQYDANV